MLNKYIIVILALAFLLGCKAQDLPNADNLPSTPNEIPENSNNPPPAPQAPSAPTGKVVEPPITGLPIMDIFPEE